MSFFSCFELNSKVIRIRIKNYIFPHKALKNQNTHTQIMITLHWIHFCNNIFFVSFRFHSILWLLISWMRIFIRQFCNIRICSCLPYLMSHIICIDSYFFFTAHSFHLFAKICPLLNQFHTSCVRVDISFGSHFFFHIHIFWYCVCILFRLVKRK